MVRNLVGILIALAGAGAAVWSTFLDWFGSLNGNEISIEEIFTPGGLTGTPSELLSGLLPPILVAAVLALLGVVLRSRLLTAGAGALVLGITFLWMIRQGVTEGSLTAGGGGLDIGTGIAVGGGLAMLLGAALMTGRRRPRRHARGAVPDIGPRNEPSEPQEPWESGPPRAA